MDLTGNWGPGCSPIFTNTRRSRMRHLLYQGIWSSWHCSFSFLMMCEDSKDTRRADVGNHHNSSVEDFPCRQSEVQETREAEPLPRPSDDPPAIPTQSWELPSFSALCLPIKANLRKGMWQGEPSGSSLCLSTHQNGHRACLQPFTHPRQTETLFPLQCSMSYRRGMGTWGAPHAVEWSLSLRHPAPTNTGSTEMQKAKITYALEIPLQSSTRSWISQILPYSSYLWEVTFNNPCILLFLIFSCCLVRLNKDTDVLRILPRVYLSPDERILTSNWLQLGWKKF